MASFKMIHEADGYTVYRAPEELGELAQDGSPHLFQSNEDIFIHKAPQVRWHEVNRQAG